MFRLGRLLVMHCAVDSAHKTEHSRPVECVKTLILPTFFQQTDVNLTRNGLFFPAIQAFFVLA